MSYLQSGLMGISSYMLMIPPHNFTKAQADMLAPAMTEAFMSHYQGDEGTRPPSTIAQQTKAVYGQRAIPCRCW